LRSCAEQTDPAAIVRAAQYARGENAERAGSSKNVLGKVSARLPDDGSC
jgi:hypothetical protein